MQPEQNNNLGQYPNQNPEPLQGPMPIPPVQPQPQAPVQYSNQPAPQQQPVNVAPSPAPVQGGYPQPVQPQPQVQPQQPVGGVQYSDQPTPNFSQPQQQPNGVQYAQPQSAPDNQNPYTIDYLNEIAPKQKGFFFDTKMKILAGGLAFVLILGIFMLMFGGGGNETSKDAILKMYLRLQSTGTISKDYQKKIKNSKLSAINSGLTTNMASSENDLKTRMDGLGISLPKKDNKAGSKISNDVDKESEKLNKTLDNAHLNAVLDRTYAREMKYHLEVINSSVKSTKSKDNSKATVEVLNKIEKSLEVSIKQFEDYLKADS